MLQGFKDSKVSVSCQDFWAQNKVPDYVCMDHCTNSQHPTKQMYNGWDPVRNGPACEEAEEELRRREKASLETCLD